MPGSIIVLYCCCFYYYWSKSLRKYFVKHHTEWFLLHIVRKIPTICNLLFPFTCFKKFLLPALKISFYLILKVFLKPPKKVTHQAFQMGIFCTFNFILADNVINKLLLFVKHLLLTPTFLRMIFFPHYLTAEIKQIVSNYKANRFTTCH